MAGVGVSEAPSRSGAAAAVPSRCAIGAVEVRAVGKVYEAGERSTTALRGVELHIQPNEFVALIGPSGAGKTTLLKIIAGLLEPTSGSVLIDGEPVRDPNPDKVAVVFQNFALLPWRTVLDNAAFGLRCRGRSKREARERAMDALARVGLERFARSHPHQLSSGMQQRVGFARALAVDPQILLMDEPFGALDMQTRRELQEHLLTLWQDLRQTVVFVTHAMDEAVYLADRVAIMSKRPSRITEVVDITLARPRDPDGLTRDPEFARLHEYVWHELRDLRDEEVT